MEIEKIKAEIELKHKLKEYLNKELDKIKKIWLKNKSYQNTWIKLNNISFTQSYEVGTIGDIHRAGPGEKSFAEYEIDSRLESIREIWFRNYENPDFFIILTPLTSGYDFIIQNKGYNTFFETKSRNYRSDSDVIKEGVAIESMKLEEAQRDRYYEDFYYTNSFKDGNIFTWHIASLPNWVWVPRIVSFPDSTINYTKMKSKLVYFLPLDLRMKNLDLHIS